MVRPLTKHEDYTRKDVHDIFSPETEFIPSSGLWGGRGIIRIPDRESDFIFFVTYGRQQSEHTFAEVITEDGILFWQSERRQKLGAPRIQKLIGHNHLENSIYLFLRASKFLPYTYFGRLAYLEHDSEREMPVHFRWQILDWDLPSEEGQKIGLEPEVGIKEAKAFALTETPPPAAKASSRAGVSTPKFKGKHIDYEETGRARTALGKAGELAVLGMEKECLIAQGCMDLANRVLHVSDVEGDGAGYDIRSYTSDGSVKYIEVKTTTGGPRSAYYMSRLEVAFSENYSESYYLYRLYDFNTKTGKASFFVQKGRIADFSELQPFTYIVRPS